jgi:hypothetical protein
MDRRGFLKLFSAGVAGIALEQAIPLGRVWSFPKKIVIASPLSQFDYTENYNRALKKYALEIGDIVTISSVFRNLHEQTFIVTEVHENDSWVRNRDATEIGLVPNELMLPKYHCGLPPG